MDAPVSQLPTPAVNFPAERRSEPFHFTGTGAEYFRIWIVNLVLTILTLGIYSAWAKVRRLRYFYGNTQVAGSSFEYHGRPGQILKGRLIAASVLIPYFLTQWLFAPWHLVFVPVFLFALPFLVVKSRLFSLRMTSWRNIRFDFTGTYGAAARIYLALALLTGLSFGLLAPYWTYARQRYLVAQTRFGATQFDFRARAGDYYVAMLLGGLIVLGGILVATLALVPIMRSTGNAQPGAFDLRAWTILSLVLLTYLLGFAFIKARLLNVALNGTHVGPHQLECRLQVLQLFWIYLTNALAALVSLGLLIPWAQVRLMRYQLERTSVQVAGNLDDFVGTQQSQVAAAGEELGDLLDVDFGL